MKIPGNQNEDSVGGNLLIDVKWSYPIDFSNNSMF